jgi:DNA-binding transcriptional MerR regulator
VTQLNAAGGPRRTGKPEAAFRTTGEVSEELELPAHVLRFWESKFPEIKPLKRGGGRRYYRPEDIDLLRQIRQFLYQEGYTIRGVQKLLRKGGQPPTSMQRERGRCCSRSSRVATRQPRPRILLLPGGRCARLWKRRAIRLMLDKLLAQ